MSKFISGRRRTAAAYGGLAVALGSSPADSSDALRCEHCEGEDASLPFRPAGLSGETCAEVEYWYEADPSNGLSRLGRSSWPFARVAAPRGEAARLLERLNRRIRGEGEMELTLRELLAARLYAGPMGSKYEASLRAHAARLPTRGARNAKAMNTPGIST